MNATQFYLQQKLNAATSSIEMAQARIPRAQTLIELVRTLNSVHIDHLVRQFSPIPQRKHQLENLADQRAEVLAQALIAKLSTDEGAEHERTERQLGEGYRSCCGNFPRTARLIEQALAQHRAARHRAAKSEAPATAPADGDAAAQAAGETP